MPFQSKAQRRLFYAKKAKGEMSQQTIDEWEAATPKRVPERVKQASQHTRSQHIMPAAHTILGNAYLHGISACAQKIAAEGPPDDFKTRFDGLLKEMLQERYDRDLSPTNQETRSRYVAEAPRQKPPTPSTFEPPRLTLDHVQKFIPQPPPAAPQAAEAAAGSAGKFRAMLKKLMSGLK